MKKAIILAALAAVFAGFTLACCNPERMLEKAIEKGLEEEGGGDVDIDIGRGAKVPSDMPRDLRYPGAKVKGSFSARTAEGKGTSVVFESSSSISRVTRYYEGLENKGWTIESTFTGSSEGGEGTVFTLSKGDRNVVVTVSKDDKGKTGIIVIYGTQ